MKTPILVIIFSIIFWSLFFNFAKAQPGPIQINEAGISNYQIQATTPTTTPVAGKKYLYNENSQLKTKDSLANIERVNKDYSNHVPNFDIEEGLLPYFSSPAGRVTLNTATPIEGLRSLTFDGIAQNDYVITPAIDIPKYLMGNVCMIRVWVSGGDSNLNLSLLNGAGGSIATKQLQTFIDPTPQFITFNCPTQAQITAQPNLAQIEIAITQTTVTNAAPVILDNFYFGVLDTNTMNVTGPVEELTANTLSYTPASSGKLDWSNVTKNTISTCGTVTITDATNRFTYTGKKSCLVNVTCGVLADINEQSGVSININGAARSRSFMGQVSGTSGMIPATLSAVINAGDVLICTSENFAGAPPTSGAASNLILTATPLPQLATIVSTNQMRAGFYASKTWSYCSPTGGTNATWTAMGDCGGAVSTVSGNAIADNNSLQLTIPKLPKGKYQLMLGGKFGPQNPTNNNNCAARVILTSGITSNLNELFTSSTTQAAAPLGVFNFSVPSDLTNQVITMQQQWFGTSVNCSFGADQSVGMYLYYQPDLSDPYSTPELFAALPAQVVNSSGKMWRTEGCTISNNGVATIPASCNSWIQSVNRTVLGQVQLIYVPNLTSGMTCTASPVTVNNQLAVIASSISTGVTVNTYTANTGALIDIPFGIICQGPTL